MTTDETVQVTPAQRRPTPWSAWLALFLVLGVLKPLLTKLSERPPVAVLEPAEAQAAATGQRRAGFEEDLNAVKQMARQEPQIVANVVKDWVTGDE